MDFFVRRVDEHERLAVLADPEDAARRLCAREQIAGLVDRERDDVGGVGLVEQRALPIGRNAVDVALLAGGGEERAVGCGRERPDVFVVGVEERL
jgi:hypothetical protein